MANVTMTLEEYEALRRLIGSERESEGAQIDQEQPKKRRTRSARKNDKKMSQALKQANKELRKVNGDLRKGVTQSDIMIRAHRIRRSL